MTQLTEKQRIDGFIKDARQSGATDQEIYTKIASTQKLPNFIAFSKEAKSGGATNDQIAARLGLNLGNTQKIQIKGGKVNIEMQPIRLTAEGKPYKQFDNTKAARNTRDQEALKNKGQHKLGNQPCSVWLIRVHQYCKPFHMQAMVLAQASIKCLEPIYAPIPMKLLLGVKNSK